VEKAKAKKVKLAQMKLKQMQSLGFWGAPPRRAASLNAAAMVHCLYDNAVRSPDQVSVLQKRFFFVGKIS
jgi:hypothetical protein